MDKILIEGGRRLEGRVRVSGAKNATLPLMCAALLADTPVTLKNVPDLMDVRTTAKLLRTMGVGVAIEGDAAVIDAARIASPEAPYELVKTMRASILVLGPLVARCGRARVSLPGGCAIGERPINLHLKGLEALGAAIRLTGGYVEAEAKRLRGDRLYLDFPTVTGTENLMMAAALAEGRTTIKNAAREPEIEDLAALLNRMGARIEGAGTDMITIEGASRLSGAEHTVIPDRIEAGTFMVAAGVTGGDLVLEGARLDHLEAAVAKFREAGLEITRDPSGAVRVRGGRPIRSVDVKTLPHPGFPTDLQAQMMVLMALSRGLSVITETVFENRFMHVPELRRMGARIETQGSRAIIEGVAGLDGAPVMASDLRASAALVLAGLAARGTTEVNRIYHLDRGYERMEAKFAAVGAAIRRVRG
ncbi:MAG TPA: UDP-N-acetylglucosamine 1-carboxyvinyltransferase [Thermodesulfobacteriota bacterium]